MTVCPVRQLPTHTAIPIAFSKAIREVKAAGLNLILATISERKKHQTVSDGLHAVSLLFIFYHCWNFAVETNRKETITGLRTRTDY